MAASDFDDEWGTFDSDYCDCGAPMASDGACENEDHDDAPQ